MSFSEEDPLADAVAATRRGALSAEQLLDSLARSRLWLATEPPGLSERDNVRLCTFI